MARTGAAPGAEPNLWRLCCALCKGVHALGERVRELRSRPDSGEAIAWGSLLRAAERHAGDPWANPHALGAALDDLISGFEARLGAREHDAPLARNATWDRVMGALEARRADVDDLPRRLSERGGRRQRARECRTSDIGHGSVQRASAFRLGRVGSRPPASTLTERSMA